VPNVFWPYSRRAALVLAVFIWADLSAALALTNALAGWPSDRTAGRLPFVVRAAPVA
jgi:hypothetical protein